jgi:CheY-like chemotaxis protein
MRLDAELLCQTLQKRYMQPEPMRGKKILIADDQPGVRTAIRYLLEVDQHLVTEARDGREAFEFFRQTHFDLVITDYAMPEMPGNVLALEIKQLVPSQPIIMITAYTQDVLPGENPVDAMLSKPFSFEALRATIARLLASPNG